MQQLSKPLAEKKESSVIPDSADTGNTVNAEERNTNNDFTDEELLEKFIDPSTKHYAFNLLVRQYQQRIYWHIRRILLDHDDTNDVTQNVFIKVWHNLEKFRGESQLFTWIYKIATNEALGFLRQKKRRFFISFDSVEYQMADKLASDPLFSGDKIQLKLQQAVAKLPTQQKLIFNMKYFEGLKYEQISEILGLTVGALKASYHHAVKKVSRYVVRED
jgi:RNA polymerase sigma factor (sigma-70 family)